jgi:hypothetical protein
MMRTEFNRSWPLAMLFGGVLLHASAPGQRGVPPQPPASPRAAAPVDLTGYWVSLITEDWRFRMVTPPKGDVTGVPLNAAARQVATAWDPASDEAAGEQCRAYGAAGIMRLPGRVHITWEDDQTLKLETDAGTQTRRFAFGSASSAGGDWQGVSVAYLGSVLHFRDETRKANVDVLLQNHMLMDPIQEKLDKLAARRRGEPNPFVVGAAEYQKFLGVMEGCTRVNIARRKL